MLLNLQPELYLRLFVSFIFGAVIGLERTKKGKPAGTRTHALVCIGSCLVMVLSSAYSSFYSDPMRLAAQVVSGIGFIGAGVIWTDKRNSKHGLTTAANLWITACVGLAIGYGFYDIAFVTLILMFTAINSHMILKKLKLIPEKTEESDD